MKKLIERTTGELADSFIIEIVENTDNFDFFEIEQVDDKIILRGNNNCSVALAYNYYLRNHCNIDLSWSGNTEAYEIEKILPVKHKVRKEIKQKIRMCMDYEIYANEAAFWDYDRFEKELEFMAMNGINLVPMLVGNEAVSYYSLLELGINREDSMEFLSSPSYYPLQMSGKLDTFLPMTDTNYLKSRIELGKKILKRMKELSIKPVLPVFNGHVSKFFKGYFKKASVILNTQYADYPFTYRLDPYDPLFNSVGSMLMSKQKEFFGDAEYYLADPFYGVSPRARDASLVPDFGTAISSLIGDATLVTHACDYTDALVSRLNHEKVLIIDKDGSLYKEHKGFSGYPFVVGTSVNVGGHTTLHGSLEEISDNSFLAASKKYENAVGCGVFADSLTDNPHICALALEMLTEKGKVDVKEWIKEYSARRWGSDEKCLEKAALLLLETCYSKKNSGPVTGSIIAARPSTVLSHTAPGDTLELRYDNKKLCEALELMLSSEDDYTEGYAFDACNILRQLLSNYARVLYTGVINGYNDRDGRLFETATNSFMRLLSDLERLLMTRSEFCLYDKLLAVSASSLNKHDKQNFEIAYLCSITMFGPFNTPEHYDLLWKEWTDLVGEYYAKRWHSFFTMLAEKFSKHKTISTVTKKQYNGRNYTRGNKFCKELDKKERKWISTCAPKKGSDEDCLDVINELFRKYKPLILSDVIQ
ncbi:MAG: alpha-N-acetylglucosaminidase C-terminal domain-containing protein [Clostridia bacterium]|nr:alpha-N-acetylglucosaminidase C-terminal domain-containing protein [Clostridia bacterium]